MNCRAGDLAIIVHAGDVPSMEGRIVEVVGPADAYPCGLVAWECHTAGSEGQGYLRGTRTLSTSTALAVPDAWLRPIRGNAPEVDAAELDVAYG